MEHIVYWTHFFEIGNWMKLENDGKWHILTNCPKKKVREKICSSTLPWKCVNFRATLHWELPKERVCSSFAAPFLASRLLPWRCKTSRAFLMRMSTASGSTMAKQMAKVCFLRRPFQVVKKVPANPFSMLLLWPKMTHFYVGPVFFLEVDVLGPWAT